MHTRRAILRAGAGFAAASSALGPLALGGGYGGSAWQRLRQRLQGDLVLPTDERYAAAKQLQYAEFDAINPTAIAYCETAADVQNCVVFARKNGVGVRVRSGGHAVLGWSTGPGLVIDVTRIEHATVTGDTVHIGPGLEAIDALHKLSTAGRQVVTGTCPTVCPGGYLTGGGIGLQTRKFGIGSDRLVSAQVVLADGRLVRASATTEPDLYWALRGGGGGNFGIVVDFEVRPIDAPRMVFFSLTWGWELAKKVIRGWQPWSVAASTNLGSQLQVFMLDSAPGNSPAVIVSGGYFGPKSELDAALADLRARVGVEPEAAVVTDGTYQQGMTAIYGCADLTTSQCHREGLNPDAVLPRSGFLREQYRYFDRSFTEAEVDTLLAVYDRDRRAGQLRALHAMSLGGVANQVPANATAYVHRTAQFIVGLASEAMEPDPSLPAAVERFAADAAAFLDPPGTGAYVNFPGATLPDWPGQYYGVNYPRLVRVKRRYDPDNFFQHGRSIGSAAG
uniref:FAD-linked oxidase domain protein n=1 Tax=Micromonospora sp. HK160111 TaxID=1245497 RepID=A0A2H4RBY1_9ACTN|nr:FAD-linked oxidase domain protein [Micromonospora sp. HK160111]